MGGVLVIKDAGLVAGQTYTFQVSAVNAAGEGELSDAVRVTIPTIAPFEEGVELVPSNMQNGTKDVPAVNGGTEYAHEYKITGIKYTSGKYYIAKATIYSDVKKNVQIRFQNPDDNYSDVTGKGFYNFTIEAGNTVEVTYVFKAVQDAFNGIYDYCLGFINGEACDAAKMTFSNVSIKPYNNEPAETTGVKVISATETTKYTVTIDGVEKAQVEEGGTYTLPATESNNGYLYGDNIAYKDGAEVIVNSNMSFTSIGTITVDVNQGAGIRYTVATDAGLRFKTTVHAKSEVYSSNMLKTGTLITDYQSHMDKVPVITDDSKEVINVVNDGWYNGNAGIFCGSIVGIKDANWTRDFFARGYATITYSDGDEKTFYSIMTGNRSVNGIAQLVKADTDNYNKLTSSAQEIINAYAEVTK